MKRIYLLITGFLFCFLIAKSQGVYQLWGMTQAGGSGIGSIFSTNVAGNNFQARKEFDFTNPGGYPQYTEPVEYNGKLYGMVPSAGANNAGVIFEWDPATNIYTKKIDLSTPNGSGPLGSLILSGGKFYGMTRLGGSNNAGVIFEWNPATNIYTKKIDLSTANGSNPQGSLTLSDGKFYGMTYAGGTNGVGVIFEWEPVGNVYTKKIDLSTANGSNPQGNLTLSGGKFYGMTYSGGSNTLGVIFEWNPLGNVYTKKIEFDYTEGGRPSGSLTLNGGKLYGMTYTGGNNGYGVIFEWEPVGNVYLRKIDFDGYAMGGNPYGNLKLNGTKFYGMTYQGGNSDGGVIFEWEPVGNVYTKKIDLTVTINGKKPAGSLTLSGGKFYAMTNEGGSTNLGTIFEWEPVGNVYTKKIDFNMNTNGSYPYGSLMLYAGKFYGMTSEGGSNDMGVIFEWDPARNLYTKKFDFNGGANGNNPMGSLALSNGKFYGMTRLGGSNSAGVIFEWDPANNVYTKKIDLSTAIGKYPFGSLTLNGGKFYGMTSAGGINDVGVIFEWEPVGNVYTKKIDLSTANGKNPYGNLTLSGGKFYGMTQYGGINNAGAIFEWEPVGNVYTKKVDLNAASGNYPYGSLALSSGKFYGMTYSGGLNNVGVIFEWEPIGNVYVKKVDFNFTTIGSQPQSNLTLSGGKFYGMTYSGGSNFAGVFFEWDPIGNVYTKKRDFTGSDGRQASYGNDLTLAPAPVANGLPGSCVSFPAITIDNTNNNVWVPIIDNLGDVVAEIKANGNNLGIVTAQAYINSGTVREDNSKQLYLDRNLTITPQVQPSSLVNIRIYIKNSEYLALKNAVNSIGLSPGINTIADMGIFKNENGCLSAISFVANPVTTTSGAWESGYVMSAGISSFSSFYFANKTNTVLPLTLLSFEARKQEHQHLLSWKTSNQVGAKSFSIERSNDGNNFEKIGVVQANGTISSVNSYLFTDVKPLTGNNYYRLKMMDVDDKYSYSQVRLLQSGKLSTIHVEPNPSVNKKFIIQWTGSNLPIECILTNAEGRTIQQMKVNSNQLQIKVPKAGLYFIRLIKKDGSVQTEKLIAY